ncbi:MAG: hypothetical protein WBI82_03090 [Sphaerochaeta sp.]
MPPFPPQGAGYLTLLSRPSLGNGTMVMLVLLSLRWGMKQGYRLCDSPDTTTSCLSGGISYLACSSARVRVVWSHTCSGPKYCTAPG